MTEQPLIHAVKTGDFSQLTLLIAQNSALEQQDDNGWTALSWAAGAGDLAAVQALLAAGANPLHTGRDLRTPYQIALAAQQPAVAECLQQAEIQRGSRSPAVISEYCQAFRLAELTAFSDWLSQSDLPADAIVYLHQDLSVTESIWRGEKVIFAQDSDAWRRYCRERLRFEVPTDLSLLNG